jgi:glycolate oxidase
VLGLEYVDGMGVIHRTSIDDPGYDLTGLLVGSEGTLGLVTSVDVRLMAMPESVRVFVAAFPDVESASEVVSAIIAAGIIPTALELMDKMITASIESHFHVGFPLTAGAVLLIEIAGASDDMAAGEDAIAQIARRHGALSWRAAADAAEREALWASRKGAGGAIGKITPNFYIQDACVPRSKLPQITHEIERIAHEYDVKVGNLYHAGDGNLHPLLCFDRREPRTVQAIVEAGTEILATCISMGGTISGEHGVGHEKRDSLSLVFDTADLAAMGRVRDVFDPRSLFNPDKIFPTGAVCGEVRAAAAVA